MNEEKAKQAKGLANLLINDIVEKGHDDVVVGAALVELTALWIMRVSGLKHSMTDFEVLERFMDKTVRMLHALRDEQAKVSDEDYLRAEMKAAMARVNKLPERKPRVKSHSPWGYK